ncbi:MAG TPA: helix-turn-helix transcriptional regulator, partial [Gemmataceae bacterium]|nr:helix-turn-helix transcriptional regulator [Gemmataceae bacterium]
RLGFSVIPGDGGEGDAAPPTDARPTTVESAEDLDLWMRQQGMTTRELAEGVGLSRRLVSAYRSGQRPWSRAFAARVTGVLAAREASKV